MNHAFKSVFVTLIFALALITCVGQKRIELRINPATGNLVAPYEPEIGYFGGVEWFTTDPGISSFKIVEKPGNPRYIFTEPLATDFRQSLRMSRNYSFKGCEWYYGIIWTNGLGVETSYDPKIAVKPGVTIFELLSLLGILVTTIISIVFFSKWRKVKKELQEEKLKIQSEF